MVGTGRVYKASIRFVSIIYGGKSVLSGWRRQTPVALDIDGFELAGDGIARLGPGQPGERHDPVAELGQLVVG